ncbi:hypothetical protein BDA99DRAFT_520413 [Phascolomyces articulosus]|uniref:Protein kinase domain-containing protein n=1 Tax=Phascolomyces articulosus TaxID=60185 RepID=A0AAD5JSX0_9FUNG|nr:hypothetical protein BDA99DRAFT_520413 [Phascolomyces articulosus]
MFLLSIISSLLLSTIVLVVSGQEKLGDRQETVAWRAGHAAAYIDPYVIVYGGTEDTQADANSNAITGSTSLWVWNSKTGFWYHPKQLDDAASPQIHFSATPIPSPGQMLAVLSNTSTTGRLQKLDTNNWSWSFPSAASPVEPVDNAAGYALSLANNTLYMYGGITVDANGLPILNSVMNNLYTLDANAYIWNSASNGLGVLDHVMCYIPHANALISFGGTTTGSRANPIQDVLVFDLGQRVWSLRVPVQSVNNAVPGARRLHTANCLEDRMIIYGGGTDRPFDSDVWILDASQYPTLQWQKAPMANLDQGPNVRMGHTSVLDEKARKIYIFGGWGAGTSSGDTDMYVLDYQNWAWSRVTPAGFANGAEPTSSLLPPSNNGDTGGNGGNRTAVIVGSAVGGVVGVALIAAALLFFCCVRRKKRRQRQDKHQEDDEEQHDGGINDEKTLRNIPNGNTKHNNNNNDDNDNEDHNNDLESKVQQQKRSSSPTPLRATVPQSVSGGSNASSRGSFSATAAAGVPSLMLSEFGNTTGGSSTGSSSPRQTGFFVQTPNEIHTQKPNEFTRPIQQRSIASSMLASTGLSPTSPSDQYTLPTTYRSSVSSSVPLAQLVSPQQSPTPTTTAAQTTPIDIYESVSPLEMLATLGRLDEEQTPQQNEEEQNGHEHQYVGKVDQPKQWQNLLPSKYTLLPRQPIVGHANSIYFAMMDENTKPVVIKSFGRREAWERECRALNKLRSNHVVQVIQMLNNDATHLAILEYLDDSLQFIMKQYYEGGSDLQQQQLSSSLMNSSVRKMIAKSVISSLVWIHAKDVAFCDLKPSNIMRSAQGDWKLIDFEASRSIGQECVGLITPRYCPPEVARATTYGHEGEKGVVATASVDLWSLGCVIYELENQHHHEPLFTQTITDDTVLHFVSHPSPLTPALRNGLKWNEQVELEIPDFEQRVPDPNARNLIKSLLSRDPIKRGSASYWMKTHPYFCT